VLPSFLAAGREKQSIITRESCPLASKNKQPDKLYWEHDCRKKIFTSSFFTFKLIVSPLLIENILKIYLEISPKNGER